MKKILFSLLMLCTVVSAWSQTTGTVIITPPASNFPVSHDDETGIEVYGNKNNLDKTSWDITSSKAIVIKMPAGYVITAVKVSGRNDLIQCDNLIFNATDNVWVQNGTFTYYEQVAFTATNATGTTVGGVTITYHKHTFTHNEGKAATCTATGMTESWTCSDCGHTYYDNAGASEVAKSEDLILPIDPKHHASALTKTDAVAATCVSTGNMEYWHCKDCNHCFEDETGQKAIAGDIVTTDINPDNHGDKLKEVAHKNASVIEEGTLHHWHCEACGKDYADADCTKDITGKTVKAKYDADALLVGNTTVDESYLLGEGATVTFDGNNILLNVNGNVHEYALSDQEYIGIDFAHTFKLKANQDPDHTDDYYSTFYTSEGAYWLPEDETAKAYICIADGNVGKMTNVGDIIHKGEAVLLKASQNSILLMPSANVDEASEDNIFEGTDEAMTLGANQYAFSYGTNGIGFYIWEGKEIGANKTYLTLDSEMPLVKFEFDEEDGVTAIDNVSVNVNDNVLYNLNGVRVGADYKGIVIKNGKKYYQK